MYLTLQFILEIVKILHSQFLELSNAYFYLSAIIPSYKENFTFYWHFSNKVNFSLTKLCRWFNLTDARKIANLQTENLFRSFSKWYIHTLYLHPRNFVVINRRMPHTYTPKEGAHIQLYILVNTNIHKYVLYNMT